MKMVVMLTAAVAIAAAAPAQAQVHTGKIDLSTTLCHEVAGMKPEEVEQIVTWMQGFYTLEQAPRVIDIDKIKADITKLEDYCKANPQANLVAAGDDVVYAEPKPAAPAPAAKQP